MITLHFRGGWCRCVGFFGVSGFPPKNWGRRILSLQIFSQFKQIYPPKRFTKTNVYQVIQSGLFGIVKRPFQGLSDLQLGDKKGHFESPGTRSSTATFFLQPCFEPLKAKKSFRRAAIGRSDSEANMGAPKKNNRLWISKME